MYSITSIVSYAIWMLPQTVNVFYCMLRLVHVIRKKNNFNIFIYSYIHKLLDHFELYNLDITKF